MTKKEIELQNKLNELTEFAFELYKEARLNAELANEYIAKELYPKRKTVTYDSEFVYMVAERYNKLMDQKEAIYKQKGYEPYLRANFDSELCERIKRK